MALITERVSKNASKCKECIIQKMRDYMLAYSEGKKKTAGKGVFAKETSLFFTKMATKATFAVTKASCEACIYKDDFEKVYGMTPAEFYVKKQLWLEEFNQ